MYHKIIRLSVLLLAIQTLKAQAPQADSLNRAAFVRKQTARADTLTTLALAMATPGASSHQLNQALSNVDNALHIYSRYREMQGVRRSFDNLAFLYHLQKKHSQEKWYILQSNTLSRNMRDTPQVINSLLRLAAVKRDIKDFALAAQDMDDAATLAQQIKDKANGLRAMQTIADAYLKTGNLSKAAVILNRLDRVKDSIKSGASAKLVAANGAPVPANTNIIQAKTGSGTGSDTNKKMIVTILIISILISLYLIFSLIKKKREKRTGKEGV